MNDVSWTDEALDQLASIYLAAEASERNDITNVTAAIDAVLAAEGESVGESRGANGRIYFHAMLVVLFAVEPGRIVVTEVRTNRPRRRPHP
jgi:hypothetical protein